MARWKKLRAVYWLGVLSLALMFCFTAQAQADIYGVISQAGQGSQASTTPTYLFSFAEDGSSFTPIATVKLDSTNIDVDALAYNPSFGLLAYQMSWSGSAYTSSQLISLNPSTGAATAIGSPLSREIRGAVFVGASLWGTDASNNQLLQINPTTGDVISNTTFSGGTITDSTDLAMAANGTVYLTNTGSPAVFYTVNLATAALTQVNSAILVQNVGLAFSMNADQNHLFAIQAANTDDIDYYTINGSPWAHTTIFTDIYGTNFNAGRGDLASYVVPIPGSLLLLGSGLLPLTLYRRRSRKG
jgi:hypothetical protein